MNAKIGHLAIRLLAVANTGIMAIAWASPAWNEKAIRSFGRYVTGWLMVSSALLLVGVVAEVIVLRHNKPEKRKVIVDGAYVGVWMLVWIVTLFVAVMQTAFV